MKTHVLTGSKSEIIEAVGKIEGDIHEVIVIVNEPVVEPTQYVTVEEFFAEMTQCYFSANVAVARPLHAHAINGPDALKKYDPATYNLIDSIYRGPINLR